jgi:hypothetical protein
METQRAALDTSINKVRGSCVEQPHCLPFDADLETLLGAVCTGKSLPLKTHAPVNVQHPYQRTYR